MKKNFGKSFITLFLVGVLIIASVSLFASAEDQPTIIVSDISGSAGDTVEVTVALSNNPGLVSMTLTVNYNDSALRLVDVEDTGLLPGQIHSDVLGAPYQLTWANDTSKANYTDDGVLVTLSFKILDAVSGENGVTVSYDFDNYDVFNCDLEPIRFAVKNGNVSVHTCAAVLYEGKPATCTSDGWKDAYKCSCGKFYKDAACNELIGAYDIWKVIDGEGKISALKHNYTAKYATAEYLMTKATKCSEFNLYWSACSVCGASAGADKNASSEYWISNISGEHSYEERINDAAHLVAGSGVDCRYAKEYYFDCSYCDSMSDVKWVSETEKGAHDFSEKLEDAAHYVADTGVNCKSNKCYYFDCAAPGCGEIGNSAWESATAGAHSFTVTNDDERYLVQGTGNNCQSKKEFYKLCEYCSAPGNDTWTSELVGAHSFVEKIADNDHYVVGTGLNCTAVKSYYYDCKFCDTKGTDTWASEEFGEHSFTDKLEDAKYLVAGTGTDCRSNKSYYYACEHCAMAGTEAWESETVGEHKFDMTQWGYTDKAAGHAHKCLYCTEIDEVVPHNPNIDAPTQNDDKICKDCNIVLEEKVVIYGDVNGDGVVNGLDVMLIRKYMVNYDYDTELSTVEVQAGADANGDGTVDGLDVSLLRKYIANYDYDAGFSTVVLGPQ